MDLSLIFEMKEKAIDEQKRTVVAGVLEEDVLSANNRFYPAKVVRKAMASLSGKRSLVTHESNDPRDVVAKITEAKMKGKVGIATFKFGTDSMSEAVFSKVREGLIDAVSIRASGVTKRAKINDSFVDVVEELDISSVDWVVDGGISAARVMQVFEQSPELNFNVKENDMSELEDLKKQIEENNKKIAEMEKKAAEEKAASEKAIEEANKKASEEKLNAYRSKKLSSIKNDGLRAYVGENITGNSEKEIDESFDKHVKFFEKFTKENKLKEEIIVKPNDVKEGNKPNNVNELLEQSNPDDQVSIIKELMGGRK